MTNVIAMPQPTGSDVHEPVWSEIFQDDAMQSKASNLWRTTLSEMKTADTFAQINSFAVKRYVLFLVMYDQAVAETFKEGAVIECRSKDDYRFNPWWKIAKECDGYAGVHEDNLGLSPKRRASVTPAKKGKAAASKADEILGAKRA